jgi:lipid A 3-O-deacylase
MSIRRAAAIPLVLLPCGVPCALAEQAHFVQAQHGYGVTAFAVGARIGDGRILWERRGWRLEQDWKARIGRWASHREHSRAPSLWEVAAYPSLRFACTDAQGLAPFAEGGIGVHLLTHTRVGDRNMSTAFQFGEHMAVGARFGKEFAYSLAARAEHVSNANIKKPNDGVSFYGIELQYRWR